ncbi:50S ribosomal protein L20 [Nymphon striatum]|nr:50S ribosomal protein L20 [Nymphon striatum]
MPKMKTKSSVKKRFKTTASGKVKAAGAGKQHGMIKRSNKFLRNARGTMVLCEADARIVKQFMPYSKVKRGVTSHAKHKKVLKKAKGYYGARKNTIRVARQAVEKAGQYAYRDRKTRKRNFRSLWIQRINAAAREHGLTYARLVDGLTKSGIEVDRKVLSDIAIHEPQAFAAMVAKAKEALAYLKNHTENEFEGAVK